MAFLNIRFPENISYGANGGPEFNTNVVIITSGYEQRNANWSSSKLSYDVSHAARTADQIKELIAFFRIAKGRANSFRFKDWMDYQAVEGTLINTTGLTFQLYKVYDNDAGQYLRKITKPVSVSIYKNDVLLDPLDYVLDLNTGLVTFDTVESDDVLTWDGEFDVPARFDTDQLKGEIISPNIYGWSSIPIVEVRE
jgi:uncharacterized protein (TIGR02217 family)